jgi:hypothetical protein
VAGQKAEPCLHGPPCRHCKPSRRGPPHRCRRCRKATQEATQGDQTSRPRCCQAGCPRCKPCLHGPPCCHCKPSRRGPLHRCRCCRCQAAPRCCQAGCPRCKPCLHGPTCCHCKPSRRGPPRCRRKPAPRGHRPLRREPAPRGHRLTDLTCKHLGRSYDSNCRRCRRKPSRRGPMRIIVGIMAGSTLAYEPTTDMTMLRSFAAVSGDLSASRASAL